MLHRIRSIPRRCSAATEVSFVYDGSNWLYHLVFENSCQRNMQKPRNTKRTSRKNTERSSTKIKLHPKRSTASCVNRYQPMGSHSFWSKKRFLERIGKPYLKYSNSISFQFNSSSLGRQQGFGYARRREVKTGPERMAP